MPWTASQQSLKRPGVLQVGHQAHMQLGTRSSLTVEPAKKPRVSSMKAPSLESSHVAVIRVP